jgi:hypothetical protein
MDCALQNTTPRPLYPTNIQVVVLPFKAAIAATPADCMPVDSLQHSAVLPDARVNAQGLSSNGYFLFSLSPAGVLTVFPVVAHGALPALFSVRAQA